MNVTLTLEDELVRAARKIAVERESTLTGLIRKYLQDMVQEDEQRGRKARDLARLRASFAKGGIKLPAKLWTREELHERR